MPSEPPGSAAMPSIKQRKESGHVRFQWTTFAMGLLMASLGLWMKDQSLPYISNVPWRAELSLPYLYRARSASILNSTETEYTCDRPKYTVRTISWDPLLQHIENFITPVEREHLLHIAKPLYQRSTVYGKGLRSLSEARTSSSAALPANDTVVQCIAARASEFQGYVSAGIMEPLQAVQYLQGQEYKAHTDWYKEDDAELTRNPNRDTTFFALLDVNCTQCGTEFPALAVDWSSESSQWCHIVDCNSTESLIINAVPGSATFWRNLLPNGKGDIKVTHAGLPVQSGAKVGLNIWTREPRWVQEEREKLRAAKDSETERKVIGS